MVTFWTYFENRADMLDRKKKKKQVQAFGLCTGKRNLKLTDMEKTTCGLGVRGRLCGTFNGEE